MRVFLRNKTTRLYCAGSNGWAATEGQALAFRSVHQAARFALDEKVPQAEIILKYDLLAEEVAVPVLPEWSDFSQADAAAA
jgi:hypothetical protein